jgi:hypothetical protein
MNASIAPYLNLSSKDSHRRPITLRKLVQTQIHSHQSAKKLLLPARQKENKVQSSSKELQYKRYSGRIRMPKKQLQKS